MTTMNNDPADPSVHEPRGLDWPEPVAYLHDVVAADCEPDQALSFVHDNFPLAGVGGFRSVGCRPLYTADQMREAIAAERERRCPGLPDPHCNYLATCYTICNKCGRQHAGSIQPKWWTCPTHGDAQPNAWGCPECVREMRNELVMREAAADMTRLHTADAALADVAMMLKTCAWALRRGSAPELGERALELLKKHSLLGSPLRTETLDEAGRAGAHLYDRWTGKA